MHPFFDGWKDYNPEPQASNSYTNAILEWRHFITGRFKNWSRLPYFVSPRVACHITKGRMNESLLPLITSVTDEKVFA